MSEEIDINEGPKNVHHAYRRMRNAAKEESKRAPRSEHLSRIWDARGKDFSFSVQKGRKVNIVLLSECENFLAHPVIYKVDKFAKREYIQCRAHKIPDDVNAEGYEKTGEHCPFCTALGEPRLVAAIIVGTFDKFTRKDGTESEAQARVLLATQSKTYNALMDLAYSDASGGSLKHLVLSVSRGTDNNSCRVGETFIISKNVRGKVGKLKGAKELVEGMKHIELEKVFGPVTEEEMIYALRMHKKHCDENPNIIKHGYNEAAMNRALNGGAEEVDDIVLDDEDDVNPFESLDDIEENVESKDEEDTPATEKASDLPEEDDDEEYDWDAV